MSDRIKPEPVIGMAGIRMATTIVNDTANDLALLKAGIASKNWVSLPMRPVERGQTTWVYGYPLTGLLSQEAKITQGVISSTSGVSNDYRFLQISNPIQPGNSGGPLFNEFGDVVGVVTETLSTTALANEVGAIPQNLNFAIKSDLVSTLLKANRIRAKTSTNNQLLNGVEISRLADRVTAQVLCYKR